MCVSICVYLVVSICVYLVGLAVTERELTEIKLMHEYGLLYKLILTIIFGSTPFQNSN